MTVGPPGEASVDPRVADLMTGGSSWDRGKIQTLLPAYEEQILNIKQSLTGAPDKLVWLGTKTGEYSVKSGYYIAVETDDTMEIEITAPDFNWKKQIWSIDCAPKLKLFAWKVIKRALPVGERLLERHIAIDPTCKRCGCTESITHLFFHCPFSRKVWRLAPFMTEVECSGMIDLVASWNDLCGLKCLPPTGIGSGSLFIWIMWALWKARNRFLFEGFSASPEDTLTSAIVLAREWSRDSQPEKSQCKPESRAEPDCPTNTIVVRTDAAWAECRNEAGLGWVLLRNPDGQRFKERMEFVSSPLMAEALALREAITSCRRLDLKALRFESDSSQLIKIINSGFGPPELHGIVSDILYNVSVFDFSCFVWIRRERNIVADELANAALLAAELLAVGDVFIVPN